MKQKSNWTLLNLYRIKYYLDEPTKVMLVKLLVISKLDNCNGLYMNIGKVKFRKLSAVLNSCVRFIYNVSYDTKDLLKYYILAHILPMEQRVQFKVCLLAYKVMYGLAPVYLEELLQKDTNNVKMGTRTRPDYDICQFKVPKLMSTKLNVRRFSYYAPGIWNALPFYIRSSESIDLFKKKLKTFYFDQLKAADTAKLPYSIQ